MQKLDTTPDGSSYQYVGLPLESETNRVVFGGCHYLCPVTRVYIDANPNYKQGPRY